MADAAAIAFRLNALKASRSPHETVWRDCFDYTFPLRADGFQTTTLNAQSGQERLARLVDGTGTDAARILSSGIISGATPANSLWFQLGVAGATDLETRWLEGAAQTLFEQIHGSNYDSQAYECALDLVCAGWFALYIEENKEEGGFTFEQWPLSQVYGASTKRGGVVDIVYREFELTAEQAVAEYGDGSKGEGVSTQTLKLVKDKPDEFVNFVHAIYPRLDGKQGSILAKHLPIASCHVEIKAKKLVREGGYHEMPVIMPRWHKLPRSVYAVGPANDALPDMRCLNELKRMMLQAADMAATGMYKAVDDGVLNPRNIKVGARKVITVGDINSIEPLTSGADFNISFTLEEHLQATIRKTFMADQLQPQDGPQMTATEVHVRVGFIRQLLGPVYGRMQAEWLAKMIQRCFGVGVRSGMLKDAPVSLNGRAYQVRYISPLARAQRQEEVTAMDQFELALAQQAQIEGPRALDIYDSDEARRERAHLLGVPAKLILSEEDLAALRTARAKAQQDAGEQQAQARGQQAFADSAGDAAGKSLVQ